MSGYDSWILQTEEGLYLQTEEGDFLTIEGTPSDLFPSNPDVVPVPDNNLVCDRTGFMVTVEEGLKKEWTGAMVRKESYEPRHPQDFVRARPERTVGSPRPEQPDLFLDYDSVTPDSY